MSANNKEDEKAREIIDSNLLILNGGVLKTYNKGEYIFKEGQQPHFYHQIIEGKVRMVSENDDGKEFIQGFFSKGESFGEPPIFIGQPYPASAIAEERAVIIRLIIPSFIQLLKENFEVHFKITKLLSNRIKNKALALKEIASRNPEQRIISLLNQHKKERQKSGENPNEKIKIDYTRKQIADMSGLRVETVIRVMRSLYDRKVLSIEKGKVFY